MSVAVWILAILLALAFLASGLMKIVVGKKLEERMPWAKDFGAGTIRTIGLLEVLGAIGLVLPGALGIGTFLGWLAAFGLALVMVGAAVVHVRRGERREVVVNVIFIVLLLIVGIARIAG